MYWLSAPQKIFKDNREKETRKGKEMNQIKSQKDSRTRGFRIRVQEKGKKDQRNRKNCNKRKY